MSEPWRLLEHGEMTVRGDQFWSDEFFWDDATPGTLIKTTSPPFRRRVPISQMKYGMNPSTSSGWISVKEREPVFPCLVTRPGFEYIIYHPCDKPGAWEDGVMWMPAPPLPMPPNPDEQAWEEWSKGPCPVNDPIKHAFLAGIAHGRGKK